MRRSKRLCHGMALDFSWNQAGPNLAIVGLTFFPDWTYCGSFFPRQSPASMRAAKSATLTRQSCSQLRTFSSTNQNCRRNFASKSGPQHVQTPQNIIGQRYSPRYVWSATASSLQKRYGQTLASRSESLYVTLVSFWMSSKAWEKMRKIE